MKTKIEYVTDSWNPVIGCSQISPGCDNCYAIKMASRINNMMPEKSRYKNIVRDGKWTGEISLSYQTIMQPYHWKKPRRVFVCDMGDLFFEKIHYSMIYGIISTIARNPVHTFLILTKRPKRMKEFFSRFSPDIKTYLNTLNIPWPIPNLWLGVTAENQQMAEYRIPLLLKTPAIKRFVSYEPALGPLDLTKLETLDISGTIMINALKGTSWYKDLDTNRYDIPVNKPDWIICGCESGPGHREMKTEWARSVKNQCEKYNIPFFLKQVYMGHKLIKMPQLDGTIYNQIPR